MNYLTKKQLSIIIFFIPMVFKMSMLPSMLFEESGFAGYFAITLITTIEFLQMGLVLFVVSNGGIGGLKRTYNIHTARAIAFPLLFVMGVKCLIFITEIYYYVCHFMFYNVSSFPVIVAVLLTLFYLGSKGAKAIGRVFELSIWLIPLILLLGLFFGKASLQFSYLTHIFDDGFSPVLRGIDKYLLYTFDFSPLLFFKIEPKKNGRILFSSAASVGIMTSCYCLFYATYGRASYLFDDAFAKLASFDTVISEIGTLDLPSVLLWLTSSIGNIALKFVAMAEILKLFKIKRQWGLTAITSVLAVLLVFVYSNFEKISAIVVHPVRYVVIGIELAVPVVLLVLYAVKNAGKEKLTLEKNG